MPPRFELDCMGLDDPRDLGQLTPILSFAPVEPWAGEPELRVSTVALDVPREASLQPDRTRLEERYVAFVTAAR